LPRVQTFIVFDSPSPYTYATSAHKDAPAAAVSLDVSLARRDHHIIVVPSDRLYAVPYRPFGIAARGEGMTVGHAVRTYYNIQLGVCHWHTAHTGDIQSERVLSVGARAGGILFRESV